MKFYHGSNVPNLTCLKPFPSNHKKPYVYLTKSKVLAAIYAHNHLTRPNGFYTYRWGKDGILRYDEYFENQLEMMYSKQTGYIYECEGEYMHIETMPWVYLSDQEVSVHNCTEIPDLYEQLLQFEKDGLLIVRRWNETSDKQKEIWKNAVKQSLADTDCTTASGKEYFEFIKTHFQNI